MRKVKELDEYRNRKITDNNGGDGSMGDYATLKDLKNLEDKINLKFEMTEKNIKIMFLEEREFQRKNKNEAIKWIIGTGIAIIGLTFTFIRFFVINK
jgi:hypothetical protein